MNGVGRFRGPLILTVWAFAPPIAIQSEEGRDVTVSVGAVQGQYELISRSCEGDVLFSEGVPFRTGAVQIDYEARDEPFRATAFGGVTSASGQSPEATGGGPFLGGVIAYEGERLGLGGGPAVLPAEEEGVMPSLYLRVGGRDGVHLRGDFLALGPMSGATGLARAGVGFGGDRASALVGLSAGRALDFSDEVNSGPFAEFAFSLTPGFEALVAGSWFTSEIHPDWATGVGLRWRPGS